jgi:hypothetical protein
MPPATTDGQHRPTVTLNSNMRISSEPSAGHGGQLQGTAWAEAREDNLVYKAAQDCILDQSAWPV